MLRSARRTLAVASIAFLLTRCRDAERPVSPDPTALGATGLTMSRVAEEPAPLVLHPVAPRETDPSIDRALADHYVWLDTTARGNPNWRRGNPKLLLFLPGNNNQPAGWLRLEQEAARLGYHVIGLMYQNDVTVVQVCLGSPDPDCSGNIHLEVQDGIDRSTLVNVTWANSIENRLAKVLRFLADSFPDEGWSRFLEDTSPKWSQIAVAGQSQGAAQAAMIGKVHSVNRVVMFSGPPDANVVGQVDPWVSIGLTPAAKYFALFHKRDHLVARIPLNLAALDMLRFGDPVLVGDSLGGQLGEPPYGGTHVLTTDLRPTLGYLAPNAPHQSTARDNNTPLGPDRTPLLRAAWRYLLGDVPRGGAAPR